MKTIASIATGTSVEVTVAVLGDRFIAVGQDDDLVTLTVPQAREVMAALAAAIDCVQGPVAVERCADPECDSEEECGRSHGA